MWGGLPLIVLLTLLIPLGLTFYGWKIASENSLDKQKSIFQSLALENEKALFNRLNSYEQVSKGAVAYFNASEFVSREEWRDYINRIGLPNNYPGMNGLGIISPVPVSKIDNFVKDIQRQDIYDFNIHPVTKDKPYYIIKYIEPLVPNRAALGLNVAFEKNRLAAAQLSTDTNKAALTKKITLIQDEKKNPGFLLFNPIYKQNLPVSNIDERRSALIGWVYAPLIAKNILHDLTNSQGATLNIKIYQNDSTAPENLIYSSGGQDSVAGKFQIQKNIEVLQQKWLVEWSSTDVFDEEGKDNFSFLIIIGGVTFTGLLGIFIITISLKEKAALLASSGKRVYILPLVIFCLSCIGSYALFIKLEDREHQQIENAVAAQFEKIEVLIRSHAEGTLLSIDRMAKRWDAANGIPKDQWEKDASNYTKGISGLRTIQWVDSDYRVRWISPLSGNEKVIGLNILFNKERETALRGAAEKNAITLTPTMDLVQGYKAFIAYAPVHNKGKFDGFMAAIFSIDDFFNGVITNKEASEFNLQIDEAGQQIFSHKIDDKNINNTLSLRKGIKLYDKNLEITIEPTSGFIEHHTTPLEEIILAACLLISGLAAFAAHSIIIMKTKSNYLSQANRFNRAIMDSSAYLVIATDTEGKVTSFNKSAEKALGYLARDMIGRETPALWHDKNEIFNRAQELSEKLGRPIEPGFDVFIENLKTQTSDTHEWTFISKSGHHFPVSLTATAIKDTNGQVTGYLGVVEDITLKKMEDEKRLEIEERLKLSEEGLQLGLEGTGVGMWDWDVNSNTIVWSDRFNALLGYGPKEIPTLYSEWEKRLHPDDRESTLAALQAYLIGTAESYVHEYRLITKKGEWRWFRATGKALRNVDGSPRRMVGSLEDINERKVAQEKLAEASEFNRLIVETNPDFVFVKDSEFRIVSANASFLNVYPENDRHEVIGKTTFEKYNPDEAEKFLIHDRQALETGIAQNFEKIKFPNGEIKHLFTIKTRFYNSAGEAFILGISRDITLLKQAEADRENLMESLTRSNTELERFAYIASHDMQEPIRMVTNFSRIISEDYASILDDDGREYLKLIIDAGTRMTDMVNDLLAYSRMGNEAQNFKIFSGEDIFLSAEKNLHELIKEKSAKITHTKLPDLLGNPIQIIRLFQNLLANAMKYQKDGGIAVINVDVAEQDNNWLISVKDNGVGIKPEFIDQIFQPFRRLHTWEQVQGTGLGLSICQKIVENHGGKIWVTSNIGEGSIFYFTLPKVN